MKHFNVVFGGQVSGGHKVEEVKKKLAALFKADEKKIDQLFAAPQMILKRNIDYDQALKYQKALRQAGAICDVEEVIRDIDEQAADTPGAPPIPQPSGVHMVGGEIRAAHESETQAHSEPESGSGVGDIIVGLVLITIGLMLGGWVFTGHLGPADYFFNGLGLFWVGKGIFRLVR